MKGSTFRRCACTDPATGKQIGRHCPKLKQRRHGTWGYARRLDTTGQDGRDLRRLGFATEREATEALDHVAELVKLAGADDATRRKIGDMIFEKTKRGGQLPSTGDVRRRLGAGADPAELGVTFGEAWRAWLAGKRKLRQSARERLEQIGAHWLLPVLEDVALERLNGVHCTEVFARVEHINAAIAAAHSDGSRAVVKVEGDVRDRPRPVGDCQPAPRVRSAAGVLQLRGPEDAPPGVQSHLRSGAGARAARRGPAVDRRAGRAVPRRDRTGSPRAPVPHRGPARGPPRRGLRHAVVRRGLRGRDDHDRCDAPAGRQSRDRWPPEDAHEQARHLSRRRHG